MSKVFLVYKTWGICDDSSVVGVFLNERKADEYIEVNNKAREEENKRHEKCSRCRGENYTNEEDSSVFRFENTCDKAVIKEDRHGLYCENDDSDYYETVHSNSYWKVETDILG